MREEKPGEDRERLTRIIHDNAGRLERLVSDVLSLNRRDRVSAAPLRLQPWLGSFVAEAREKESGIGGEKSAAVAHFVSAEIAKGLLQRQRRERDLAAISNSSFQRVQP